LQLGFEFSIIDYFTVEHTIANFGLLGPICEPISDPLIDDFGGRIWRSSRGGE